MIAVVIVPACMHAQRVYKQLQYVQHSSRMIVFMTINLILYYRPSIAYKYPLDSHHIPDIRFILGSYNTHIRSSSGCFSTTDISSSSGSCFTTSAPTGNCSTTDSSSSSDSYPTTDISSSIGGFSTIDSSSSTGSQLVTALSQRVPLDSQGIQLQDGVSLATKVNQG